ncbi:hypothetical protein [Paractinoplanes rishiriensis]|uniref:Uncharacterized protein n=1 Tax=Paractinoplanes rishiriensis TaxID=1050105 RepID=A0A919K7E4_9ACTN|nr:hypothetical protein [Actinoplanes rishiriensis]GIF00286.1 hypothetical protein Ari01nite_77500 [Actinoplanes rishiriensis]
MKFFSNEPKDNPDDDHGRDRGSDVVTSDPVAVPQQRAGSPWSDSPAAPEAEFSDKDRGTTTTYGPDGTVTESVRDDSPADALRDDTVKDDALKDDALKDDAAKDDSLKDDPFRDDSVKDDAFRDDTSADTAAVKDDTVHDDTAHDDTAHDGTAHDGTAHDDASKDDAFKDDGTFDSPKAVDPATGDHLDKTDKSDLSDVDSDKGVDSDEGDASKDSALKDDALKDDALKDDALKDDALKDDALKDDALKDEGTFDSPVAVNPATGDDLNKSDKSDVDVPAAVDPTTGESLDNAEPVVAPVPVNAATPGSVPAPDVDRLFADGDSFAERFREIQLTFVDSPKEATAQAAALVTEAVEAVTAALTEKKNAFAAGSEDTEQLRVELRGYRDLLKRISEL